MTRAQQKDDFSVDVEGLGRFVFGRRTQRDVFKIRGAYCQMTGHNWKDDGTVGDMEAWMYATLEVMTVSFPDGFSLESIDPLTGPEDDDRIQTVYMALRQKELSFRPQQKKGGEGTGEGAGQ